MKFGMFHQLRLDGGKEFYLILGMQELFSDLRSRQDIAPYRQTESKMVCFLVIVFIVFNNFCEIKRLTCGVLFILNFVKIAFSESTKNSFINFYFFHFHGFSGVFLCVTQNIGCTYAKHLK